MQRLTKQIHQKYYERKVSGLRTSIPRNWWRAVKQLTGLKQKSTEPQVGLAQRIHNGDVHALADHINKFTQQVASDLRPLSVSTTPPTSDVLPSEFIIEQSAIETKLSLAKAFDHVDHNILISRLTEFGLPDVIIQWTCSFLRHRRQRVKIGEVMSNWLVMNAGMPQGSYVESLNFISLVDSLQASCMMTHKYADDTLSEIVAKSGTSNMQVYCDELVQCQNRLT